MTRNCLRRSMFVLSVFGLITSFVALSSHDAIWPAQLAAAHHTACSDGIDNDGDGTIDFPADTGCDSEQDNDESQPSPGGVCHIEQQTRVTPTNCEGTVLSSGLCDGEITQNVTFDHPFEKPPHVLVTLEQASAGGANPQCLGGSTDFFKCFPLPDSITRFGFKIVCEASPASSINVSCTERNGANSYAQAAWIAVEDGDTPACPFAQSDHLVSPGQCNGVTRHGFCDGEYTTHVTFAHPFSRTPHLVSAAEKVSSERGGSCNGFGSDKINCLPTNITPTGYDLTCNGSIINNASSDCGPTLDPLSTRAAAGWLAMEEHAQCRMDSGHGIETTSCTGSIDSNGNCQNGQWVTHVSFNKTFSAPPRIVLSPEKVSSAENNCANGETDYLSCTAFNITTTGMDVQCNGSPPPGTCNFKNGNSRAKFGYLAIAQSCNPEQQKPQCSDGKDNDGDGKIDFPNDPQCDSPQDPSEFPECSDGIDNDGDGKVDCADPGCHSDGNASNFSSCVPSDDDERDEVGGPVFEVIKEGPATVTKGATAVYTIRAKNVSSHTTVGTVLADFFQLSGTPDTLQFVSSTPAGCDVMRPNANPRDAHVLCEIGTVASGGVIEYTLTFRVTEQAQCGETIMDRADINAAGGITQWSNKVTTTVTCDGGGEPNLHVEKTGPDAVHRGGEVRYHLHAVNTGNAAAQAVVVTDIPPAELTFVRSEPAAACVLSGAEVDCVIGTFGPGQERNFTLVFRVKEHAVCDALIVNRVDIKQESGPAFWTDEEQSRVVCGAASSSSSPSSKSSSGGGTGGANLVVEQTGPGTVQKDGTITFRVTASNAGGQTANGVVIASHKGGSLSFASGTFGCIDHGNHVACGVGNLGGGASKTVEVTYRAGGPCKATLESRAVAQGAGGLSSLEDTDSATVWCEGSGGVSSVSSAPISSSSSSSSKSSSPSATSSVPSSSSLSPSFSPGPPQLSVDADVAEPVVPGEPFTVRIQANNDGTLVHGPVINLHGVEGLQLTASTGADCTQFAQHVNCPLASDRHETVELQFTLAECRTPINLHALFEAYDSLAQKGVFALDEVVVRVACP